MQSLVPANRGSSVGSQVDLDGFFTKSECMSLGQQSRPQGRPNHVGVLNRQAMPLFIIV